MQVLIGLSLCLFVALGIQSFRIGALKEEAAQKDAAISKAQLEAAEKARALEQQMADNARKAADEYAKNVARVRANADGARTELDRLRDSLAAAGPIASDPTAAARTDEAARARFVVGKLAEAAATVSAAADECEARLEGLQSYVRGISK